MSLRIAKVKGALSEGLFLILSSFWGVTWMFLGRLLGGTWAILGRVFKTSKSAQRIEDLHAIYNLHKSI